MVLFKIGGERNSGTTFLANLLRKNRFPVLEHIIDKDSRVSFWKHGIPKDEQKSVDERVVDIFIFKELEGWLVSMYNNPYEIDVTNIQDFRQFLETKHISNKTWKDIDGKYVNEDDNEKTIFDIRYYKFQKINEYRNSNKDVIFISLSYLQDEDNTKLFLSEIYKRYIRVPRRGSFII